MKKLLLILLILIPALSFAGDGDGGSSDGGRGGKVVRNGDVVRFLDVVKSPSVVPWDVKNTTAYSKLLAQMQTHPGYFGATYYPWSDTPRHNGNAFTETTRTIGDKIAAQFSYLKFYVIENGEPLPISDDAGIIALPWQFKDGTIANIALQDTHSGTVLVDGKLLRLIPDFPDVSALLEHEALISVWTDSHPESRLTATDKIGDIVNLTFVKNQYLQTISPDQLSQMMCRAGLRVAAGVNVGMRSPSLMWIFDYMTKKSPSDFVILHHSDCRSFELTRTTAIETSFSKNKGDRWGATFKYISKDPNVPPGLVWVLGPLNPPIKLSGMHYSDMVMLGSDSENGLPGMQWPADDGSATFSIWQPAQ